MLDTALSTRIALYRLFTKIWNSVALNGKSSGGSSSQPVERHLSQIPRSRVRPFSWSPSKGCPRMMRQRFWISMHRHCANLSRNPVANSAAEIATECPDH